jgi:hypothetical protein
MRDSLLSKLDAAAGEILAEDFAGMAPGDGPAVVSAVTATITYGSPVTVTGDVITIGDSRPIEK